MPSSTNTTHSMHDLTPQNFGMSPGSISCTSGQVADDLAITDFKLSAFRPSVDENTAERVISIAGIDPDSNKADGIREHYTKIIDEQKRKQEEAEQAILSKPYEKTKYSKYQGDDKGRYSAYKDGVRVYGPDGAPERWEVEEVPPCVLYAFDGTGNDMFTSSWTEGSTSPTNVEIMFRLYKGRKRYAVGVGTNEDSGAEREFEDYLFSPRETSKEWYKDNTGDLYGNLFGAGIEARFEEMMNFFRKDYQANPKIRIHIIGFSRGAAAAREFANRLCNSYGVEVEFLGIFDTVAQEGLPDSKNENDSMELRIHEKVNFTFHPIAKNEYRTLFPLTSITNNYFPNKVGKAITIYKNPLPRSISTVALPYLSTKKVKTLKYYFSPSDYKESNTSSFYEKPYKGAHSDIGGGYTDYRNEDCYEDMFILATTRNVPLQLTKNYKHQKKVKDIPDKLIDGSNQGDLTKRNYHGDRIEHIEGVGHDSRRPGVKFAVDQILDKELRIIYSVDYAKSKRRRYNSIKGPNSPKK